MCIAILFICFCCMYFSEKLVVNSLSDVACKKNDKKRDDIPGLLCYNFIVFEKPRQKQSKSALKMKWR